MKPSNINSAPLYNSRIIDTYIKLIKAKYSYINISDLLNYAGMEPYQVEDEGHWFTQEQINLFYEELERLSGNKEIAGEAGRYAASPDALGVMRQYILAFIGLAKAYEKLGHVASKFTRSSVYQSRLISPNKVEITVTPNEGVHEKQFQCENRIGYFEAFAMMFNYNLPEIEHPECLFKGGKVCRYTVSWKESRTASLKKIRSAAAISVLTAFLGGIFLFPLSALISFLAAPVLVVLLLNWYTAIIERRELVAAIDNLKGTTDKLLDQINLNYNNALTINEIGQALSKQIDINDILIKVVQVLEKRLDYDRGLVFLSNQEKTRLIFQAGFGYTEEQLNLLKKNDFHLDRPDSKGVFVISFREQRAILVSDIEEIAGSLSPRSIEIAEQLGAKSFICCPIVYEGESLGLLLVDNKRKKRPLNQSDINLLMGITPEIGICIHNAMLIESAIKQFKSVIQVLAASIDARDPLTSGHSEKVAEYAVGICKEMGLQEDYSEMLQIAALLHDYGKIGIDDNILKKPGKLNPEEAEIIKTHTVKTKSILDRMHFKGIYRDIPEIAWSHHEKVDGSGYPRGLRGEDILLGARIIAVADFFEAITSKRHYREPMPLNEAFDLLKRAAGSDYDDKVVSAFTDYYHKNNIPDDTKNQLP